MNSSQRFERKANKATNEFSLNTCELITIKKRNATINRLDNGV